MAGYVTNIEKDSLANSDFRHVLFTGPNSQLVLMTLKPGEEIGEETHDHVDQFFRIESGKATAVIEGKQYNLEDGSAVVIRAGTRHNIINASKSIGGTPLKLYTVHSPPNHPDGTVHKTKAEAMKYEAAEHH